MKEETHSSFAKELAFIASIRQKDEADILADAVREGVRALYREALIEAYLLGRVSRAVALAELGPERIDEVDFQREALKKDLAWGSRMNEAVADTGPVLHLEEINRLVALRIFERRRVPSLVASELERYGVVLDNKKALPSTEIVSVEEERRQAVLSERGAVEIHPADAEVVVVAREARFRFPVLLHLCSSV